VSDPEPTVLKLGGSVVTRKDEPETVDDETLADVCETIAASLGSPAVAGTDDESGGIGLVLVHGGGSFGHYHADRHGVTTTDGSRDATAIGDIHAAMTALNAAVVGRLRDAGVSAVPVRPFSAASRDEAGDLAYCAEPVRTMLAEGLVPVLHGDVVVHAGEGATICSGDELVVTLARSLAAERVGLCTAVPGVLDETGAVVGRIDDFADVSAVLGGSQATDVTGGMAAKIRALLDLEAPATVFGVGDLGAFLAGEDPGTSVGYES
jgi:isopentenyl phosphate kinase